MPFIGKQPQAGAYSKLDAITTSATATYNLTLDSGAYYPQSANHLLVSLNGVIQAPQDSFTVSGSQITFDSALTSADVIDFIIALGDTLDIGVPSAGSVNTSQLANDAVTSAKLDTNIAITGDLAVDTDTLFADASADKVGVNTTAMDASLEVNSASSKINTLTVKTAAGSGGVAGISFMAGQTTAGREKAAIFFKETNGGAHYTGDIVFAVASSSGSAAQVAASDEVCRITTGGLAIGGTGAANTLDDYEEGTWTPTLNFGGNSVGLTFGLTNGIYTKIGNIVSVQFRIELTNKGSSTGGALFGGLPFTATNLNGNYYPAFYGLHHDVNSNGSSGNPPANVLPIGQIAKNDTTWYYYAPDSTITINNTYFNNNSVLNGAVVYRTDS